MAVRGGNGGEGPVPAVGAASVIERMWGWGERHLLGMLVAALVVSIPAFAVVAYFAEPPWLKALEYLGIGMSGVLLAIGVTIANRRARAMEEAARAQAEANKGAEDGRRQERLKNAIEHLGHESDSVRLGGAYELFHLAQDTEDLRQTVLDILCAHIRRTTGEDEYRERYKSKPSEEIQSLLTLLFVKNHKIFKGCNVNLQRSWLNGAALQGTRLKNAEMGRIYLREANLDDAYLVGAWLAEAELQGARLVGAYLPGAYMYMIHLQGGNLGISHLRGVQLFGAHLEGANLARAQMQGANLAGARLQGAHLSGTNLQGVTSENDVPRYFADHIRASCNQHSDLDGVIFEGGLSRKYVDTLVGILSDEEAGGLRWELEPHIDKEVGFRFPEDSNAVTEPYAKEEAEKWIEEYEEAMFGDTDRLTDEYEEAMRGVLKVGEG